MKVVGAIIRNELGEYLLQLRDDKAPSFPHHWTHFGGVVEQSESCVAALRRELREELNLQAPQIRSIHQARRYRQGNGTVQIIFDVVTTANLDELTLREGAGMALVHRDDVLERPLAFNMRQVLSDHLGQSDEIAA